MVALAVAFGLWLKRGGTEAHHRALGRSVHVLVRTASKLFALHPDDEIRNWPTDRLRSSTHTLIVLCRNAGPAAGSGRRRVIRPAASGFRQP